MKCALCGQEFSPSESAAACSACALFKNCRLLRCPNCGFETPQEPKWLRKVTARLGKERRDKAVPPYRMG